jgi:hypothetical protein
MDGEIRIGYDHAMRTHLFIALVLTACAHSPAPVPPFSPPQGAASAEELLRAFPPDLFRGSVSVTSRVGDTTDYLTYIFLKTDPEDQVPMKVALYTRKQGGSPSLVFVALTPFVAGDCRRGECRARIAEMPGGFQLTRESFGADNLRADYRFTRSGSDLALLGKGFQVKNEQGFLCSVFYDYVKRRILHRRGKESRPEKMADGPEPRLIADQLRFDTAVPETLCALPASAAP